MKPHCSIEALRESLSYDPASGKLRWKRHAGGRASGDVAGCYSYTGYIHVNLLGKMYQAHRIAWAIHYGEWPVTGIDHINGNGTDNRIENLRCVPQAQNNKTPSGAKTILAALPAFFGINSIKNGAPKSITRDAIFFLGCLRTWKTQSSPENRPK